MTPSHDDIHQDPRTPHLNTQCVLCTVTCRAIGTVPGQLDLINGNSSTPANAFTIGNFPLSSEAHQGLVLSGNAPLQIPLLVSRVSFFVNIPGLTVQVCKSMLRNQSRMPERAIHTCCFICEFSNVLVTVMLLPLLTKYAGFYSARLWNLKVVIT
jgi:hypothetical protein